eukprot:TRINITY_DN1289_c0_g1_i8.p1 TRINITY_DN1289_c0_g1~~TRINITY_DN1289_c0_g1_i8.p1  ORF type:complete len:126 (-),score=33.62 TRINITY_DN1289_c0_g1_i8:312-668(-)
MPSTTDEIVISDGEHDLFNYGANPPGIDKFSSSEVVVSSSFHKTNTERKEEGEKEMMEAKPSERKQKVQVVSRFFPRPTSSMTDEIVISDGELDLFQQKRLDSRFNYGTNPPCKEEVS